MKIQTYQLLADTTSSCGCFRTFRNYIEQSMHLLTRLLFVQDHPSKFSGLFNELKSTG